MKLKKALALLLSMILLMGTAILPAAAATPAEQAHLQFREDGSFRILNFSDIQDDFVLSLNARLFLRNTVRQYDPDLIVLTGDNIAGYRTRIKLASTLAIKSYMNEFERLGVPVALVFGNHDDEDAGMSKEEQMALYEKYTCCVAYDEGDAIDGVGTYNVPIYASDDSKVAFNLWMIDSGTYDEVNGGYDHVKQSQLDWYRETSDRLAAENGGLVPSIAFQHIIVPEIYDALQRVPEGTPGALGTLALPETAAPGSVLGEWPCPGTVNGGEFETFRTQGDVLAIVSGHDHVNSFVVPYKGIDLINTPTCGFSSYGDSATRGARIIDLNEAAPTQYETQIVLVTDVMQQHPFMQATYWVWSVYETIAAAVVERWEQIKTFFVDLLGITNA